MVLIIGLRRQPDAFFPSGVPSVGGVLKLRAQRPAAPAAWPREVVSREECMAFVVAVLARAVGGDIGETPGTAVRGGLHTPNGPPTMPLFISAMM